jgi:hypothetical protein
VNAPTVPPADASPRARPPAAAPVRRTFVVLLVATVVMVLVRGVAPATLLLGSVLVVAAVARLLIPAARIPSLVVRSRFTDSSVLAVLGIAIAVLGQLAPGA